MAPSLIEAWKAGVVEARTCFQIFSGATPRTRRKGTRCSTWSSVRRLHCSAVALCTPGHSPRRSPSTQPPPCRWGAPGLRPLGWSFARLFVPYSSFVVLYSFLILYSCICAFTHSFILPFRNAIVNWFMYHSLTHSFIRAFILACIYLLILAFLHSCIHFISHLFIPFIHLSIYFFI